MTSIRMSSNQDLMSRWIKNVSAWSLSN